MKVAQESVSGLTQVKIGATKDTESQNRRISSLIIANTYNGVIGVIVYLATDGTGASVDRYIIGGPTNSYLKMQTGYTADIFQGTPFEYPATHELYVKCAHGSHTADVIMNYEKIDNF